MPRETISPERRARLEAGRDEQVKRYSASLHRIFDPIGGKTYFYGDAVDTVRDHLIDLGRLGIANQALLDSIVDVTRQRIHDKKSFKQQLHSVNQMNAWRTDRVRSRALRIAALPLSAQNQTETLPNVVNAFIRPEVLAYPLGRDILQEAYARLSPQEQSNFEYFERELRFGSSLIRYGNFNPEFGKPYIYSFHEKDMPKALVYLGDYSRPHFARFHIRRYRPPRRG